MIDRVEDRFGIKPKRLIGEMAYGTAQLLSWMVNDEAIEPHVPLWDRTQRKDSTLSSSKIHWSEKDNEYRCPQGNPLRSEWRAFEQKRSHITLAETIIYRPRRSDCDSCLLKSRCCSNAPIRKIVRSIYEPARDVARAVASTPLYRRSRRDRKKVEMLFAPLKRILNLRRLRLRGSSGTRDEFLRQYQRSGSHRRQMAKR